MHLNKKHKHQNKFAVGYGRMERMGETIKMKGKTLAPYSYAQASDNNDWIRDTPAQRGEVQWKEYTHQPVGTFEYRNGPRTPYVGAAVQLGVQEGPAAGNATATWTVRGEKEWQTWAGEHNEWLDNQTAIANTRIPYHSTVQLLQLDQDGTTQAAAPTWTVRGEKEWQGWAQDHNDWLDNQTKMANSRPPYNSTIQLVQLEDDGEDTLAAPRVV
jgi:hypothetical protein